MTTYHVDAAQVSAATQTVQGTIGRIQSEVSSLLGQLTGLQSSWSGQARLALAPRFTWPDTVGVSS